MELHVEAMFTHDRSLRIHAVNEPWPGDRPAPLFFLGRTVDGAAVRRFRYDVPDSLIGELEALCADEPDADGCPALPKHFEAYRRLLRAEHYTAGPCFLIPECTALPPQTVGMTRSNVAELACGGFEWLSEEIEYVQPCAAVVRDGRAVSICRSVRVTPQAHEAGLETLEAYRGQGFASAAVAGWAAAVRSRGSVPLYSTSWDNMSSQRVAGKSGLVLYGASFTIR